MLARRQGLSMRGYRTPRLLPRLPKLPLPAGATAQTGILARAGAGGPVLQPWTAEPQQATLETALASAQQ
jgi:hypothetical protein